MARQPECAEEVQAKEHRGVEVRYMRGQQNSQLQTSAAEYELALMSPQASSNQLGSWKAGSGMSHDISLGKNPDHDKGVDATACMPTKTSSTQ